MTRLCVGLIACCFSGFLFAQGTDSTRAKDGGEPPLRLGNFSVSLAVKDIAKSREFYEKLGFRVVGGNQAKNWLVLQSETTTIGLFQGFFEKNSLTFNPGWDSNKKTLPVFDDVRDIQQTLKSRGLTPTKEADVSTTGPAYLTLTDPDGNPVLIDQHVPKPAK
jgi:catechol 2,3-dioxygenase-like lactoylglutathione lyase family enzyme